MRSRLLAAGLAALIAVALSGCARDYIDGQTVRSGDVLRPGETPTTTGQHVPANDTTAQAAAGLAPLGPAGAPNRAIDPEAPKQSNGGSGSEYGSGFGFEAAKTPAPAR